MVNWLKHIVVLLLEAVEHVFIVVTHCWCTLDDLSCVEQLECEVVGYLKCGA